MYNHWWSLGYARADQGCSSQEEGNITTYSRGWECPRMTIALLEKKIEDPSDVINTLEQRIDEEHVYRKSLQHDLNTLNHFVAKIKKWELGSHFDKAQVLG